MTPGGVAVRNVAQPVIDRAFGIYCLETDTREEASARVS